MAILTVYDNDGNPIPIPAIQGPPGTNGTDGQDGEDGYSPAATITQITGGHTVKITDKQHPSGQTFNVMDGQDGAPGADGQDGYTPVRGVDYWTASDKAEIVEDVLEEIYQGADLGLQIVTQLNQPSNPADNMIWVETETSMPAGKYMVSSQRPTTGLVNGYIWFREMHLPLVEITLPGSHVSLSIAQVWQYVNGVWVWKAGHVYKAADQEWKDTGVYWFKAGTGFNSAVFGAVYSTDTYHIKPAPDNAYLEFERVSSGSTSVIETTTLIPSGKYHYLVADAEVLSSSLASLKVGIGGYDNPASFSVSQELTAQQRNLVVIDISGAAGTFVPKCVKEPSTDARVYNLWLV